MSSKKILEELKKGSIETSDQGTKKIPSTRWNTAQNSEEEYWSDYTTESLLEESAGRYPKKAKILLKEWSAHITVINNTKILQIGCGPEDVINYFQIGELYSIDPLAEFYKRKFNLDYNNSNIKQARGEEIPFPDKCFDIVILINVLDHTEIPDKVISEANRVLKDNGIFHFENYIYQKKFIQLAKTWGKIKETFTRDIFNIHHPFMFTVQDVKRIVSKKFTIIQEDVGRDIGIYENLEEFDKVLKSFSDKATQTLRRKILTKLGFLGVINYMCICKKKDN